VLRWFAQKVAHACLEAPGTLGLSIVRRQCDDSRDACILLFTFHEISDAPGRLQTIHHWHIDVHENRLELTAVRLSFDQVESFLPIRSQFGLKAVHFDQLLKSEAVEIVIIDDQHLFA